MIKRYTNEEIENIWDIQTKFEYYLKVELAVCEAQAEIGNFPKDDIQRIKDLAQISAERIEEIEQETHHDVIAFITNLKESVGKDLSQYIHIGLTSSDIIDTAFSLQIQDCGKFILKELDNTISTLKNLALEHKNTICIGRSHGMHAEIMTFGLKLLNWVDILEREKKHFTYALEETRIGQISGAIGTYSNISPEIEKIVCKKLNLKPARISTQIIARDIYAYFIQSLSMIATVIEQFATEIRHLQRTEIMEAAEGFSKGQKGSSAMPHKKNPILSENLCGLARVVRANSIVALENIPLWHERDISHSSAERIIFPDSTTLIAFMLKRFNFLMQNIVINKKNMLDNTKRFGDVIYSQRVNLKLIEKGIANSYEIVQNAAIQAISSNGSFRENIKNLNILSDEEFDDCFNTKDYLKNIDEIFLRFDY
jgi:adenylosuccinate lyase